MGRSEIKPGAGYRTISALPNDRELAALVGDLTVAWAHAERMMYFAFWVASGTTQGKAFDIFEALSGPKSRFELMISLFEQNTPDHPDFDRLISKIKKLVECGRVRNEIVHRTWVTDDEGRIYLLHN